MKRFLLSLILVLAAFPASAAERYSFDKSHTSLLFFVNHMGFSNTVGRFTQYDGSFTFDQDNPEQSSVEVSIDPRGIVTQSEALDSHLQKDDFFHTEKFPQVRFVSKEIKVTGENKGTLTGDLTLLGITKPVTLAVKFNKAGIHPMTGNYIAGFTATGIIKRSEFGMDKYIPQVSDEIRLHFEVEGVNEDRKPEPVKKS